MTLGGRLKRQRALRKLSQRALARLAGIDQPLISMLESDQRAHTRSDVVLALAKVLGCTTDYLLGMHEEDTEARAWVGAVTPSLPGMTVTALTPRPAADGGGSRGDGRGSS